MSTATTADTRSYVIDPIHSSVHFAVRHLMISKVRGVFKTLSGSIKLPADSAIPLGVTAEIDATSIETRDAQRDGHLKSEDFLHAEKFASITFTSTDIRTVDATHFTLIGDLEIRGVKRSVTFDAEVSGEGKDPWGNSRVAYEAATRINRKDYGLVWSQTLETGGVMVGDDVDVTLDIESVPAPA